MNWTIRTAHIRPCSLRHTHTHTYRRTQAQIKPNNSTAQYRRTHETKRRSIQVTSWTECWDMPNSNNTTLKYTQNNRGEEWPFDVGQYKMTQFRMLRLLEWQNNNNKNNNNNDLTDSRKRHRVQSTDRPTDQATDWTIDRPTNVRI